MSAYGPDVQRPWLTPNLKTLSAVPLPHHSSFRLYFPATVPSVVELPEAQSTLACESVTATSPRLLPDSGLFGNKMTWRLAKAAAPAVLF